MSELAINWISIHYPKERFTSGLSRIQKAIDLFEINTNNKTVVTVGGTNGKGTVSSLIYENILENNQSAALFTSPHLISICERFSFNGVNIEDNLLLDLFKRTHEKLIANNLFLSFYEFTLIVFLVKANLLKIDFIVLEVGLGGRLDATNAIDADIAVLTNIARDHVEILGKKYKEILFEKLGIVKEKTTFIASFALDYLYLKSLSILKNKKVLIQKDGNNIDLRNKFILENVMKVLNLNFLKSSRILVSNVTESVSYSCCHNLDAVRNLVADLRYNKNKIENRILLLSYSHRDIKDLVYMSKLFYTLKDSLDGIYITQIGQFKAADQSVLRKIAQSLNIPYLETDKINDVVKNKKIYLSGSNYFIGSFLLCYCNSSSSR